LEFYGKLCQIFNIKKIEIKVPYLGMIDSHIFMNFQNVIFVNKKKINIDVHPIHS